MPEPDTHPLTIRARHGLATTSIALLLLTAPLYIATSVRGSEANVDVEPVAAMSWNLARTGTVDLSASQGTSPAFDRLVEASPFIDEHEGRTIGNRPPGLWLIAVPAYVIAGTSTFSVTPSTVVAILLAVLVVQVTHVNLRACLDPRWAFAGAATLALGTATWPISSAQLWPHAPAQLLLATALLLHLRSRPLAGGGALGAALLVRPVTAVVGAVLVTREVIARSPRAALMAVPIGVAGTALVLYNGWAFGSLGVSGGYSPEHLKGPRSPGGYVVNVVQFFIGRNGMLIWSPILIIGLLGLHRAWRDAPRWARDGAIAGAAYIIVHAALNRASGGYPFASRYPLEAITTSLPMLVLGARAWIGCSRLRAQLAGVLLAVSVFLQASVAFTARCVDVGEAAARCTLW